MNWLGAAGWVGMFARTIHTCTSVQVHGESGLHLEIDPRGSKMSIYEKEGG